MIVSLVKLATYGLRIQIVILGIFRTVWRVKSRQIHGKNADRITSGFRISVETLDNSHGLM